jgi:5S rRNA maturation endonuclease (ribonuclease M5)
LPCRKIILATDNDEAGMKARKRIRANVKNKIITEYILPQGKKDLNELTEEEFNNLEEVF